MSEYIEREAAILTPVLPKEYRKYQTDNLDDAYEQGWEDALDNLKNAPAVDVAPVVHGRWHDGEDYMICLTTQTRLTTAPTAEQRWTEVRNETN